MRFVLRSLLLTAAILPFCAVAASAQDGGAGSAARDDEAKTNVSDDAAARLVQIKEVRPEAKEDAVADIEVTGSRLTDGDVTTQKIIITREQIKARGVTSVEDLIRTLPQNVNTIGAITNERGRGPLQLRGPRGATVSQLGGLGVSAANLGGMGAANTLVLVNGRRMAGAAGIEDGFVNLNGIPLSAIERVEIIPSGSAAIYGADALSGVINFILRKDGQGLTLGSQAQFSSTDADSARFNGYGAFSWGSGRISGTADYQVRKPVNNRKSGYVTDDYSSYFGGDSAFDYRRFTNGLQPGVIDQSTTAYDPATNTFFPVTQGLTVRPGLTRPPTAADFVQIGRESLRDFIPRLAGPESKTLSFTANIDQKITDRLSFYAQGLYTRAKNSEEASLGRGLVISLAPGQAYNPFPAFGTSNFRPETDVAYLPGAEIDAGLITPRELTNTATQWSATAGLTYEFNKSTRLNLIYTTSRSTSHGSGLQLGSVVDFQTLADGRRGCYNAQLAGNQLSASARATLQEAFDRQCLALTSADPNIAFNPFKTSATGGGDISTFLYNAENENRQSRLQQYEARLAGSLMTLPAGSLTYAVGGEYIDDGASSNEINLVTGGAGSRDRSAFFGEVGLPLLGNGYDLPLIRALTVNIAARRDVFITEGAIGTVNNVPYAQGGELLIGRNKFARITPSYGIRYQPFEQLTLLAKWGRGFQPPPYTQLFTPNGTTPSFYSIIADPFYDCVANRNCVRNDPSRGYLVPQITAPNVDLKPQTSRQESFTASWRPTGFLNNLQVDATYNRTVIRNEFARLDDIIQLLTRPEYYSLTQFFPRNANNKVTQVNASVFNILGSTYSSMTYEASYLLMTGIGNFEPRVVVVDNLKAERQALAGSTPLSTLGKIQGPDDYKVVGSLNYFRDHLALTLWAYHTPSYVNDYNVTFQSGIETATELRRNVASYTTFDLTGSWATKYGFRLNFAVRNLFNPKPPFALVLNRPYDTARYNANGRTAMVQVEYNF